MLEMVSSMEEASGKKIPYTITERRTGDTEAVWASTDLAKKELEWEAKYDVNDMCKDQWRWISKNPTGYE